MAEKSMTETIKPAPTVTPQELILVREDLNLACSRN